MACVFYGLNSWLPDAYVERGWSDGKAGALLAVLNIAALVTTIIIPWLADRRGSRRLYLLGLQRGARGELPPASPACPGGAWVWAAIAGLCTGVMFPLVMTLPVDVGRRPADVGAIAGMMLGVGYTIGAVAPLAARRGARRDRHVHDDALADRRLPAWCSSRSARRCRAERIERGVTAPAAP